MCWLSKPESMSRNQVLAMVGWSLSNMFAGQYIALGCGLLLREVKHLDYSHQTRNYKYPHATGLQSPTPQPRGLQLTRQSWQQSGLGPGPDL